MSLLSSTQGTPERVWSLLNLLAAHDGSLGREEVVGWLSPPFVQGREPRPLSGEPDGQSLGAASSLNMVRRDAGVYRLEASVAKSYPAFADQVHARLCSIDADHPDSVVLETFAWVAVEVDRRNATSWVGSAPKAFADAAEAALGPAQDVAGERRFNDTKIAPWRRWISLVGLGVDLPGNLGFYPYVAERLLRELSASGLAKDTDLPAEEVLSLIAQKMPYLDGGLLHTQMANRLNFRLPSRRLSRLLSIALRDLHDEGKLVLRVRGDASNLYDLASDGQHSLKTVQTIKIKGGQ